MDKLAFETLEKLLDEKLKNHSESNTKEIAHLRREHRHESVKLTKSIEGINISLNGLKTTSDKIHHETKATNGRVTDLENQLDGCEEKLNGIEKFQLSCPIARIEARLNIIDEATSFKQALVKNPRLGKRIFWIIVAFVAFISLPIWVAYWDVILDIIGSLSRATN